MPPERARRWSALGLGLGLAAALLALAVLSVLYGSSSIGPAQLLAGDQAALDVVLKLRLPRTCLALLTGACLALSGALMQTFFRNPLAEPYITGVSAGGALGAVIGQALGLSGALPIGAAAGVGGALITAALYAFALRRSTGSLALILLGIALGTFCGSLVHLVLMRMGPGEMEGAIGWLLGRVSTVGYDEVWILLAATVIGGTVAALHVPALDALLLGEEKAATLGFDLLAARRGILGAATLLATVCVAFCGVIAFVGLIVPHILRGAVGALHGRLLSLCALGGAALTLCVDLVSRVIDPPREIPLTIITSLLGAPFFILVLLRNREVRV